MKNQKYGKQAITKAKLEKWPNPYPDRDYTIEIDSPEFTCLCPRSGYPDFAVIKISYIPDQYIVELKSLKLYLNKLRNRSLSHEAATNQIFDNFKQTIQPRYLEVVGDFNPRGNVKAIIRISM
jgi:7-cyano-7-deazaguanine reductase